MLTRQRSTLGLLGGVAIELGHWYTLPAGHTRETHARA